MFEVTTREICETCEEVTPHGTRRIAVPPLVTGLLFAAGIAAAFAGRYVDAEWVVLAPLSFGLALAVWLRDRGSHWRIACERCRFKRIAAQKPDRVVWLNGQDIIDFF